MKRGGYIDAHEFNSCDSQARTLACRLRKHGFCPSEHNSSIRQAITAYNKHILSQYDPESLGVIRYLPDGRVRRSTLWNKKGSQPYYRRLREKLAEKHFHSRFYIINKGRYKTNPYQEYIPSFVDPDTGEKRRGSVLASSQTLMNAALRRYSEENLNGEDALQILLTRMFDEALQGDRFARAEILARVLPVPRDATLKLVEEFDPSMDAATLMRGLIGQLATGQVSPSDAKTAFSSFESLFRTESFERLVERIDAIERSRVVSHQSVEQSRQSALDSGLLVDDET